MCLQRSAFIAVVLLALVGCGSGERLTISMYGEGTGAGEFRITNDEGQVVVGGMDSSSTAEGELAAGSHIEISAAAHPGSHFVSFGGDCSSTTNPLTLQLNTPLSCSVKFDKD